MDLDHANMAHAQWKVKLRSAIASKSTLETPAISKDNLCEFGQWLHGEAKAKYGSLPSYGKCVSAHAAFHIEAGKIASLVNGKRYEDAHSMLELGTPFSIASGDVTGAILQLQKEVHSHTGVFLGDASKARSMAQPSV